MTSIKLFLLFFFVVWSEISYCQDTALIVSKLDEALRSKRKMITEVLTDTEWMHLHSITSFREIIKKNANTEEITIVTNTEPGTRIVVNGTVTDISGKPLSNILIYFYHTSDKGWYSDTGVHIRMYEGDHKHSRLFGYVKTDSNGKFKIRTIRPNGYPQSGFAGHIHIQMWKENGTYLLGIPGELQFDDDIRMTAQRRQQSLSEGFQIAKNDGTKEKPIYNYFIKPKSN